MIDDETIERLRQLTAAASPAPWRSMVEGRDHVAGDNFIMVGPDDALEADMYLMRDTRPASVADQDFIAAARNSIGDLLDEIERLQRRQS